MKNLLLMAVAILCLFSCEKETLLPMHNELMHSNANTNNSTTSCSQQLLQGLWVKTGLFDANNAPIQSSALNVWTLHRQDSLNFSSGQSQLFASNSNYKLLYYSKLSPSHNFGNIYTLDARNCQLNVGIMSCGIMWYAYRVVSISNTTLVLEYIYNPNSPSGGFMSSTAADAHTITYRKVSL
ncbi:MAG: hypothetical protein MK212_22290 [Saprospiraceae bacterium]|nr:hypothetical protein [Saprospiraceae bacterium]